MINYIVIEDVVILFENWSITGGYSSLIKMANPDQKTILLEQAYEEIKEICAKFQEDSGASDIKVKTLLREIAIIWEKENQIKL